ncbi:MAG TPA: glycosyltransferase [Edaphocola sp.]|nr:glycosyltransferase [Edaphocola sp.]
MKLLFTANRFPYPPYRGDKLKIFHLARILSQDHELHLITFLQDNRDRQFLPELEKYFTKIHLVPLSKTQSYINCLKAVFSQMPFQAYYFKSARMAAAISALHTQERFDAVHVQHLRMAQYWARFNDIPRILDLPDAYSLYWKRRIKALSGIQRWFARTEQRRVYRYEQVLGKYDLTLVCSKEDRNYLMAEHHLKNIDILPNGVDTDAFAGDHDYRQNNIILFTGNMDYAPNVDAVIYFSKEIFPAIRQRFPGTKFVIAGQRPVKKVLDLAGPAIEVTGFVKDLSMLYRRAAIVVAPLRFGAGTQNKVLEAMAMGVPVVSGRIGFEGLGIRSGEGVILATATGPFIESCCRLLSDAALRKATGEKGKARIRENFAWPVIARKLESRFKKIIPGTFENNE